MKKPTWLIKAGAKLAEKKPEILVGTGIALMAGAAVLGCVQTAKHMNSVLDDHNAEIEDIKENCPEEEQDKIFQHQLEHCEDVCWTGGYAWYRRNHDLPGTWRDEEEIHHYGSSI